MPNYIRERCSLNNDKCGKMCDFLSNVKDEKGGTVGFCSLYSVLLKPVTEKDSEGEEQVYSLRDYNCEVDLGDRNYHPLFTPAEDHIHSTKK